MIETIIGILAHIGDIFVDLWMNKIIGKHVKKKEENREEKESADGSQNAG